MKPKTKNQIKRLLLAAAIIIAGLIIFKFLPMQIWGENILFDASSHVAWTVFFFYFLWFFIDQNKKWRPAFFALAGAVITIMAIQRIFIKAHNEIGVLLGLVISLTAIYISERKHLKGKLEF